MTLMSSAPSAPIGSRHLLLSAVASLLIAGTVSCGQGASGTSHPDAPATAASAPGPGTAQTAAAARPLAQLRDGTGLVLSVTSAVRTQQGRGFLTVSGTLTNTTSKSSVLPATLRGDETEILTHGQSLAGATLIDAKGAKQYYVLRDTDGHPLTTTGLSILDPHQTAPVFMQFPSPPADTTQVTLVLPTFATGLLRISG